MCSDGQLPVYDHIEKVTVLQGGRKGDYIAS